MDDELWVLRSAGWSLPILVRWKDKIAGISIGAGIPLLNIQRAAAQEFLKECGAGAEGGRYWMARERFLLVAVRAQEGIQPEDCVEWSGGMFRGKVGNIGLKPGHEFIEDYCKHGMVSDPIKAAIIWQSFIKHALHWLVNKQKPLDIGFATLLALPLRVNWKDILLAQEAPGTIKGHRLISDIFPMFDAKRKTCRDDVWRLVRFFYPEMISYCIERKHIYWSLDITPKRAFWRATLALEQTRRKISEPNKGGYFQAVVDTIKRVLPHAIISYQNFARQTVFACVEIRKSWRDSLGDGTHRKGEVLPAPKPAPECGPRNFLSPIVHSAILDETEEAAYVSAVPYLRPVKKGVRQRRVLPGPAQ